MVYGNVFLQNNITEEDVQPMSLEEQVELYQDIIESMLLCENEEDVLNEITASGFEYTAELRNLLKETKPIIKDFKKAYKDKDKKTSLKKLDELDECIEKSKKIVDKIKPDVMDTVISVLFSLMKVMASCAIIYPVTAAITKNIAAATAVSVSVGYAGADMSTARMSNPYQQVKGHKQFNSFRNRYFYFYNEYKKYIKLQKSKIKKEFK